MSEQRERTNRAMLRVRDTIDRDYREELDVATLAAVAHVSPDHLIRTFRSVFGETPHRYLQRRRVERAMHLLRTTDLDVTDVCLEVGFTSLGTFSRLFSAVVGETPTAYAARTPSPTTTTAAVPGHFVRAWTRPSTFTHGPATPSAKPSVSEKRDPGSRS